MSGGNSGAKGGYNTFGGKSNFRINIEKQNRHIPGTKEFDPAKSPIDLVTIDELDEIIKSNISNAIIYPNGKMILELPKDVGHYRSLDGTIYEKTNRITIHTSKTGYHAVPARRKEKK